MRSTPCPLRFIAGSWTLLLVAALTACSSPGFEPWDPALHTLQPSATIEPPLRGSMARLSGLDGGKASTKRALQDVEALREMLYDPNLRAAAEDSILSRWTSHPQNVLWPFVVVYEWRYLENKSAFSRQFTVEGSTDTTTAVGAHIQAWYAGLRGDRGELDHGLVDASDRLAGNEDELTSWWIRLRAAYGCRRLGHYEESVARSLDLLDEGFAIGGRRLAAHAWEEIARARLRQGQLDDALLAAAMADTLTRAASNEHGVVFEELRKLELEADVASNRGDAAASIRLYDQIVERSLHERLTPFASKAVNAATRAAEIEGDRRLGLRYARLAVSIARADHDSLNVPRNLVNVAERHRMLGTLDSCRIYLEEAERWVFAYGDSSNIRRLPSFQAKYYAEIGQNDVVDSLLEVSAFLSKEDDDSDDVRAELHLELIRGNMEIGRPDRVWASIQAIEEFEDGYGDIYADRNVAADLNLQIGSFLIQRNEFVRATRHLDAAEAALARRSAGDREFQLARNRGLLARERGRLERARMHFERAIEIAGELEAPSLESEARLLLGSVELQAGRYAAARAVFPSTDAESFRGTERTRVPAILLKAISHLREGNTAVAIQILEEARAECGSSPPPDLVTRIDIEMGRALAGSGRIDRARRQYEAAARRLESTVIPVDTPELAFFNGDLRRDLVESVLALGKEGPRASLELASRLMPGWRLSDGSVRKAFGAPQLVYFVGEEASGRWTIDAQGVQWDALPSRRELEQMITPVIADLSTPGRDVDEYALERLSTTLLHGVHAAWPQDRILGIVPDLALARVPWAALRLPATPGLVIDHGAIVVFDRPAESEEHESQGGAIERVLALGSDDPDQARREGLARLHDAESEAREVANAWKGAQVTLRIGDDAAGAFAPGQGIESFDAIHVASHALVYTGDAERTTLVLSGDASNVVTTERIGELSLRAQCVYLSACEAGDGGGLNAAQSGLAHSFLRAGARSVIAPLNVIDDASARGLAVQFHEHLRNTGSVPHALRLAQLDVRDRGEATDHPFHWAFHHVFASADVRAPR